MLLQSGEKNQLSPPDTKLFNDLKEAMDNIKEGKIKSFDSIDDFFKELDA